MRELETVYDTNDLADFHEAIDIEIELEEANAEKIPKAPKAPRAPRARGRR